MTNAPKPVLNTTSPMLSPSQNIATPPLTPSSSSPTSPLDEPDNLVTPNTPTLPHPHARTLPAKAARVSPSKPSDKTNIPIPPVPVPQYDPWDPDCPSHSLHAPLKAHLAMLHPSTPAEVIEFCALRLLSPQRPYGYQGEVWQPLFLDEPEPEPEPDRGPSPSPDPGSEHDCRARTHLPAHSSQEGGGGPTGLADLAGPNGRERREKRGKGFDLLTAGVGMDASKSFSESQCGPGKRADQRLQRMYEAARQSWRLLEMMAPGVDKL